MGVFDVFCDLTACFFRRIDDNVAESSPESIPAVSARRSHHSTPTLPAEIIVAILEAASDNKDAHKTLRACSLVCRDWSAAAQKMLYRRVSLTSASALDGFVYALSANTPRSRALAEAVQSLRIVIDTNQPHGIPRDAFAQAVVQCPNLSALALALYHDSFDPAQGSSKGSQLFADDARLMLQNAPRVTTLRFDNWSDNAHALTELLEVFPSVTSLSISGTPPALSASAASPPCALEELRIDCHPSIDFVKWLLEGKSLRTLEFKRPPECELLMHLLLEHCNTLESLALPSCPSADYVHAMAQCTRLRVLRLEDLWTASNTRRHLPASLEHLAFSLDKRVPLFPVLADIEKSTALKSVTVHAWADERRHPSLPDLRIACALKDVQLDIVEDIHTFRAL